MLMCSKISSAILGLSAWAQKNKKKTGFIFLTQFVLPFFSFLCLFARVTLIQKPARFLRK